MVFNFEGMSGSQRALEVVSTLPSYAFGSNQHDKRHQYSNSQLAAIASVSKRTIRDARRCLEAGVSDEVRLGAWSVKYALQGLRKPVVNGVYFIQCNDFVKVGFANNVHRRVKDLDTGCPYNLRLIAVEPTESRKREHELHRIFSGIRFKGEWYHLAAPITNYIKDLNTKYRYLI